MRDNHLDRQTRGIFSRRSAQLSNPIMTIFEHSPRQRPPQRACAYLAIGAMLAGGTASCAAILKYANSPWIGVGVIWCVILLASALKTRRRPVLGPLLWNLGIVTLAITGLELYWERAASELRYEGHQHPPSVPHARLGYVMQPNKSVSARAYYRDASLFDVTYTIDEVGLRTSFYAGSTASRECIFFFGCSFMFGVGVDDDETIPFLVAKATHGLFRTYNFGVGGYGPHQMLAALDLGYAAELTRCDTVRHAFYWGIADHLRRAAGHTQWDPHGPRYITDDNGEARYVGRFDDRHRVTQIFLNQLRKSKTYTRLHDAPLRTSDIGLFVAIVRASKARFERMYPNGRFHVLFWDDRPSSGPIVEALAGVGIEPYLASRVLPSFNTENYAFEGDGHPTPLAHRLLAGFVLDLVRSEVATR